MTFTGVHNLKVLRSHHAKKSLQWGDRGLSQREIIAHAIDVAAHAAKVDLHINHQQDGVFWS